MRRRRHYATTGNRAFLSVTAELASEAEVFLRDPAAGPTRAERSRRLMMGDIARVADAEVDLAIEVVGSAPIERLDIFDGLDLIETVRPYAAADLGARVRLVYEGAEYRGRARTTTWDGSLTVEGTRILRTARDQHLEPRSRHPEAGRDQSRLQGGDDRQLRRHRPVAGAARPASSPSRRRPCRARRRSPSWAVEPRVFAAGGLERAVKLQRLPEVMSEPRMALRRKHQGAPDRRHPPLRPRAAGGRPPPVVEPDLLVSVIRCTQAGSREA